MSAAGTFIAWLIKVGLRIGRWLLEWMAEEVPILVVGYMRGRIRVFGRRLGRARTARRKAWLRGRIARWTAVANEIAEREREIERAVEKGADWLEDAACKRIPLHVSCERFRRAA